MRSSPVMSYTTMRKRLQTHPLRQGEIPVEFTLSLLMPTHRSGTAAYACFASPASYLPNQPQTQGAPEAWCLLEARNGRLLLFARTALQPFWEGDRFETVELPRITLSVQELKAQMDELETLMDTTASAFFAGETLLPEPRTELKKALDRAIPEVLMAQYRALAPDFFAWLEAESI